MRGSASPHGGRSPWHSGSSTARDGDVSDDVLARYPVLIAGEEATGEPELARVFEDPK